MSDFIDFKKKCIKKGLERIGLDIDTVVKKYYEKADEVVSLSEINFPKETVEKLFQCAPNSFFQIIFNPKRKVVNIFIRRIPSGKIPNC